MSFNGNKVITTGGGGMLLFNDEKLAAKAKHLTTQAKVSHPWEFVHDEIGYNYRMPNINAALGLAQLEQLPQFLENKQQRDDFLKSTNKAEVITRPAWRLMNELKMFKKCETDGFENAQWIADRLVNLPSGVVHSIS